MTPDPRFQTEARRVSIGCVSALALRRFMLRVRQADLAAAAGVTRQQIGLLERGVCRPTRRTADAIARALGTPVDALFPVIYDKAGQGRHTPDPIREPRFEEGASELGGSMSGSAPGGAADSAPGDSTTPSSLTPDSRVQTIREAQTGNVPALLPAPQMRTQAAHIALDGLVADLATAEAERDAAITERNEAVGSAKAYEGLLRKAQANIGAFERDSETDDWLSHRHNEEWKRAEAAEAEAARYRQERDEARATAERLMANLEGKLVQFEATATERSTLRQALAEIATSEKACYRDSRIARAALAGVQDPGRTKRLHPCTLGPDHEGEHNNDPRWPTTRGPHGNCEHPTHLSSFPQAMIDGGYGVGMTPWPDLEAT